jgi:exo-1,4-beta-D-glucosaminidase
VEKAYIQVLKEADWPNPYLSSASSEETTVTGPSGVKMSGPYDYVPPDYWMTAKGRAGGASGFITETSAGPSVPPMSSLRKMLPASDLVPDSAGWNYHAGSLGFKDFAHVDAAMAAIYGAPSGIDDYVRKAQAMAYDSERAMFEAYSGNSVAVAHLAFVRLLLAAGRRIFWREESVRAAARAISIRRPNGGSVE